MSDAKKYKPSNGWEGACFEDAWCDCCEKDMVFQASENPAAEDGCDIIARTLVYDVSDERYPAEWCYDDKGRPQCTAFEAVKEGGDT